MWVEYPKAMYRTDGLTCVVNSFAEEAALDPHAWFDHPNKAKEGYKAPELPKQKQRPTVKANDGK